MSNDTGYDIGGLLKLIDYFEEKQDLVTARILRGAAVHIDWLSNDRARAESTWWYELAKFCDSKWESDVKDRPEVNVYRAGMDKVWRWLEAYSLERREAIDAAMGGEPHDSTGEE